MVAESRLSELPVEKSKSDVPNGSVNDSQKTKSKTKGSSVGKTKDVVDSGSYELLEKIPGSSLVGMRLAIALLLFLISSKFFRSTIMALYILAIQVYYYNLH